MDNSLDLCVLVSLKASSVSLTDIKGPTHLFLKSKLMPPSESLPSMFNSNYQLMNFNWSVVNTGIPQPSEKDDSRSIFLELAGCMIIHFPTVNYMKSKCRSNKKNLCSI